MNEHFSDPSGRRRGLAGGISRRALLRMGAMAAVLAQAGVAPSLLAATPKRGGVFRAGLGSGSTTDSLNPATWSNQFMADLGLGVYADMLFEIDPDFEIRPNLVESWDRSDDATVYALKLKKGVRFHDGRMLSSRDVIASLRHHMGEKSKSPMRPALSIVEEIKADGDHGVIIRLKDPNADFPYLLTDYHLPILPAKEDGSLDWAAGVGTGPFRLKEFKPGVRAKAERNPDYHGDVWFDAVELIVITDSAARHAALRAGEIHYMDRADPRTVNLLKRDPAIEIIDITGLSHYTAPMDCTAKPFTDPNVRMAVKYAIDREEIVRKILLGHGRAGNDNPLAPSMKYAIDPKPVHVYDPEKARFYLKKAGLERLSLELYASDAPFAGAIDAAQLMRERARAAGIDIAVKRVPADGYWSNIWMKKAWCFSQWGGRPTADWMLSVAYAPDAPWNETRWKNERFGKLLKAARKETDEARRAAMYAEMQQLIHDDSGQIVLCFNNFLSALSRKVGHGRLNSNYDHDGGYMCKRWWFV
ncbi:ABC transporter substrate-binding protein [Thermopetrobacter sp. TC1]|uniref:ABC transporter substrate-binding protein n=1 Tax=Thermopetrobacter sp. TC1 TaxID=1495045 RepID=UPI000689F3BF|nr:ABC transporter substrate-binding protein [Thermopetrobacter sp. TC1]